MEHSNSNFEQNLKFAFHKIKFNEIFYIFPIPYDLAL